ncbi:ABC transporter substrate-binding protein [Castellaniella sp.]|uniref:ABC transporter substrate-binding protein n=1 Tax=Castellaniella sp. TaxID=1955812 RepID=UPI003C743A06
MIGTKAALSTVALMVAGLSIQTQAAELNVSSYGGADAAAYRAAYWVPFEAQTGTKVNESLSDGSIGKVRSQVASGHVVWDVAQTDLGNMTIGCNEGLFEKVDLTGLPVNDLLPNAVSECGIASEFAGTVLTYNANAVKEGPKSWKEFWDTQAFPGKRCLRKHPETLISALLADGASRDEIYKLLDTDEGVKRAFRKLGELKGDIVWWESGTQQIQNLLSGECAIGSTWNGRAADANAAGNNLKLVWEAGYYLQWDSWTILKNSPNKEAAKAYLKFALDPARQAEFMKHITYGVANEKAYALVPTSLSDQMPTTKEHLKYAVASDAEFWLRNGDELNATFQDWVSH